MQCDYDQGNTVTVKGYMELWSWGQNRVYRFLDQMGIKISYPGDTKQKQNQRGTIMNMKPVRNRYDNGTIRFINSKDLEGAAVRNRYDSGYETGTITDTYYKSLDPKPNPKEKYSPTSTEIGLSQLLFSLILNRNPKHKKPNLQKWAIHIDKAMRIDRRSESELRAVIEWSQGDSFWQNNILSTEKLRKHFDKLYMQMEGEKNGSNRRGKNRGTGATGNKYAHLTQIMPST